MQLTDGTLVLSPTDLVAHVDCAHRTTLERQRLAGELVAPQRDDPMLDLLAQRGLSHEAQVLAAFRAEGRSIVEIADEGTLAQRAQATLDALRSGADVIYQATFFDGRWRGHADFLLKRADRPTPTLGWSYDVADAKLTSKAKPGALLQMALYGEHLERLIGRGPELLIVISGNGTWHETSAADIRAYARAQRVAFEATVATPLQRAADEAGQPSCPEPVRACDYCRWQPRCDAQRREHDHLSLVAGMRGDHTRALVELGIPTVAALAQAPVEAPSGLTPVVYERLRHQARLQVRTRETGTPCAELLPPEPGRGFAALPAPSPGDLFLDLEGHPFERLEYLWGLGDAKGGFTAYWAHDPAAEKAAFEAVVDRIVAALADDPELHVYHYAPYERSALTRLAAAHASREEEVDRLLRGGVLVDLYQVVRNGLRVGLESYSIKSLETLYGFQRTADVGNGALSVVVYEQWLATRDQALLDDIERYNAEDVASTAALREWLENQRVAAESLTEVARPVPRDPEPSAAVLAEDARVAALTEGLAAAAAATPSDEERAALELLGGLVDWHRREGKPDWWEHFARLERNAEELVEDTSSVGAVTGPQERGTVARSTVWRYAFPPQETKIGVGDTVHAPGVDGSLGARVGEVVAIDAEAGWVDIRRATTSDPVVCAGLLPAAPINDKVLRATMHRFADHVLDEGLGAGNQLPAARDLLLRRPPRTAATSAPAGETDSGRAIRLGTALDGGLLAVQGPPGSGKTWTAARLVLDLVGQGQRVGLTAFSHKAIGNLLRAIGEAADERGVSVRMVQKCAEDDDCGVPGVEPARSNDELAVLAADADVVAGTSWVWAREGLAGLVDTLVVDEAGQLSLANCLVVATAARNLVLLGDPQQLAQPARGSHPAGAEVSGLAHLLAGEAVLPPDRGVFLAQTHRMSPAVCAFVSESYYDGQLVAARGLEAQRVLGEGADDGLSGAGVRWLPVPHSGCRSSSAEEVDAVLDVVRALLQREWVDRAEVVRPLTGADVLVLAPYNVQVGRIRARLAAEASAPGAAGLADVRVGTVDKLQGQEAAVVVYSTTASSSEDIPRGLEFLFSPNRFNVAVSRARALCVLVGSPQLLHARCQSIEALRLVNGFCRYVEHAS